MTGQHRSLSGGYRMTNGSRKCISLPIQVWSSEWTEVRSRARWGWKMAVTNDSTNSVRGSAMSDAFIVLFTFLAHFWMVICKSWVFAKWSSFALPSRACSNLSTCGLFRLAHSKFRLIGASLREPHGSGTALRKCVCMSVCRFACGHIQ